MNEVNILVCASDDFGSGHLQRMETLAQMLHAAGRPNRLMVVESYAALIEQLDAAFGATVVDCRDVELPATANSKKIILLDNRSGQRQSLHHATNWIYHDTIPHPQSDLQTTLHHTLIDPKLNEYRQIDSQRSGTVIYSGGFAPERSVIESLQQLEHRGLTGEISWIGPGCPVDTWKHHQRLERMEFLSKLAGSKMVLTYFGMTMLEAWYLGVTPLLFYTPSSLHNRLAHYIHREAGIALVGGASGQGFGSLDFPATLHGSFAPGGSGYQILIELIEGVAGMIGL